MPKRAKPWLSFERKLLKKTTNIKQLKGFQLAIEAPSSERISTLKYVE